MQEFIEGMQIAIRTGSRSHVHVFTAWELDKAEDAFPKDKHIPIEELITVLFQNWRKTNNIIL